MDAEGIKAIASMYGSPVQARRKDVHINCPFGAYHSKGYDTSQGLSVKIAPGQRSVCYCFSCGTRGALSFVFEQAALIDSTYADVALFIAQRDGPSLAGALATLHPDDDPDDMVQEAPTVDWNAYSARCSRQVPRYLVNRGIIKADVLRWRLGFDAELERAIFPVWDEHHHVVGCLRRAVTEDVQPKYKDTPGAYVWKKQVFYGEHLVDRTFSTVHLVEGPMGTIFAARLLPNVLGMMGADTGVEEGRLRKLVRWGIKTVVLMLDSDDKGRIAVYGRDRQDGTREIGLRELLRQHFVVKVAHLPPREDPDDVVRRDPTELRRIVQAATYLSGGSVVGSDLTVGSVKASLDPPKRGSKSIISYLHGRTARQGDAE